ncbi:heparinase [Opitutaceae bacterium TAV5]|nr:heparinase [Opitutaceae bacterium TAV5]
MTTSGLPLAFAPLLLALLLSAFAAPVRAVSADPCATLDELARTSSPDLAASRDALVAAAREEAAQKPLIRRPRDLAELRASGINMKYKTKPAHMPHLDDAGFERLALGLGDSSAASELSRRLPRIAAAARLTGDRALAGYVCAQLAELATWAPLERPGWSGGSATSGGAWLGTGWAVRAITESIKLLPDGSVSPELRQALDTRFEAEIARIRDDWRTQRSWFIKREAAYSNQWVLPNEAIVLASLFNGLDRHRDDYEFGVRNILRSLDAQGPDGEFVEGMGYGSITLSSVLSVARATALQAGDTRLLDHPFLKKFPVWLMHHQQPGRFTINAFDSWAGIDPGLLAQLVTDTGHPVAIWGFNRRVPEARSATFATSLPVFLARATLAGNKNLAPLPPPAFASYRIATRVNWIESWENSPGGKVSGLWIRGGHATDAHDHQDRGHVNLILDGKPVLIEAGLVSYGLPEHPTHFRSIAGHNVLQVGDHAPAALTPEILKAGAGQILDRAHRSAPLTVARLDATGGDITVDASGCYASVNRWVRRVVWDRAGADITDEVELREPDIILFRWHLGQPADAPRTLADNRVQVGDIVIRSEATAPLQITVEPMPDGTLLSGKMNHHACVVVRTVSPARTLTLRTRVQLDTPH